MLFYSYKYNMLDFAIRNMNKILGFFRFTDNSDICHIANIYIYIKYISVKIWIFLDFVSILLHHIGSFESSEWEFRPFIFGFWLLESNSLIGLNRAGPDEKYSSHLTHYTPGLWYKIVHVIPWKTWFSSTWPGMENVKKLSEYTGKVDEFPKFELAVEKRYFQ